MGDLLRLLHHHHAAVRDLHPGALLRVQATIEADCGLHMRTVFSNNVQTRHSQCSVGSVYCATIGSNVPGQLQRVPAVVALQYLEQVGGVQMMQEQLFVGFIQSGTSLCS